MSMDKKAEYRFNIILNPGDPMHKTAINALNNQGRHKSQFVVNAIVHYIMNDESASKAVVPDTDEIRTICREILSEMLDSIPIFARRVSLRHGTGIVILSIAIGKLVGAIIYFWLELHQTSA